MKKAKKLLAALFGVVMLVSCMTIFVFAAETVTQDGLNAVIQTDKESYAANEDIKITVTVTNTNTFEVKNVSIESLLPDALTLKDGDLKSKTVDLQPGETLSISCVAVLETESPSVIDPATTEPITEAPDTTDPITTEPGTVETTEPESSTEPEGTTAEETTGEPATTPDTTDEPTTVEPTSATSEQPDTPDTPDNPDTGSGSTIVKALLIAVIAAAVVVAIVVITKKNNKKATKVISLVLCGAIVISSFATIGFIKVGAEENNTWSFTVDKTITVAGESYTISANVRYNKAEETSDTWYQGVDENHVVTSDSGVKYINNRVIVVFWPSATKIEKQNVLNSINGKILGINDNDTKYQLQISQPKSIEELRIFCNNINKMDGVAICTYEEVLNISNMLSAIPDDPWQDTFEGIWGTDWDETNPDGLNWWLETIQAPSAWDYNERYNNIKIGIVDSGFDTNHEDLDLNVINPNENIKDNHGTHVAGIIGATANNNVGITGIVWNKELYCADVQRTKKQKNKNISILNVYEGIETLLQNGCKVVNMSLISSEAPYYSIDDIFNSGEQAASWLLYWEELLNRKDFIIIEGAGNDHVNCFRSGFFASITDASIERMFENQAENVQKRYSKEDVYKHFMIVGAIEKPSSEDNYSLTYNYGENISVVAPGKEIFSTIISGGLDGNYGNMSGTSMATPIVTGVAALVWSINPNFSAEEVKQIACTSTNKTASSSNPNDSRNSYPIVNAKLAVEEAIRRTDNQGTITGTVKDKVTGESISGVKVYIEENGVQTRSCYTNEDGGFELALPVGHHLIHYSHSNYEHEMNGFDIEKDATTVIMEPVYLTPKNTETPVEPSIPDTAVEFNGHYYQVYDTPMTWDEAKAYCESLGGHLATITSAEENNFIKDLVSSGTKNVYWLGASDAEQEGVWKWVTSEPFEFTNWSYGEPNDDGEISTPEDYLEMYKSSGKWNDGEIDGDPNGYGGKCSLANHGLICEWDTDVKPTGTCITQMEIVDHGQYTGNQGDSRVFHLDKSGLAGNDNRYYGNGNIGLDGTEYNNGLEVWIARWNFREEISWAYATYKLDGKYTRLTGKTSLIKSANTDNFDTTIYFYNGDTLLQSYTLTNEDYEKQIDVDVSGVNELKILVQDNKAVKRGTSFALYDMFLK